MLCNPHNPLGRVFTRTELLRLCEICLKHSVLILSDEIHFDLVFRTSPFKHIPLPTLSPEISDNCLVFINPSKTFNVPGLRCAATIIPNRLLREKFNAHVYANKALGTTIFGMVAIQAAYNESDYYVEQFMDYVQENLELVLETFKERIPEIKVHRPEATYLLWLDCRALGFPTAQALNDFFVDTVKLGLNDGATFGEEGVGFLRMNIACRRATLEDALGRIERAVKGLKAK